MATSGSTDFILTRGEIIEDALLEIGALALGDSATAEQTAYCARKLNLLLKALQTDQIFLHTKAERTFDTVVDQAAYTLPTDIRRFYTLRDSNDKDVAYTLDSVTKPGTVTLDETPTEIVTLTYTCERVIEDMDNTADNLDFPVEATDMLIKGLAVALAVSHGIGGEAYMILKSNYQEAKNAYLAGDIVNEGREIVIPNMVV